MTPKWPRSASESSLECPRYSTKKPRVMMMMNQVIVRPSWLAMQTFGECGEGMGALGVRGGGIPSIRPRGVFFGSKGVEVTHFIGLLKP